MRKFMLDTNTCIFTIKNEPDQVRQAFSKHRRQFGIGAVSLMALVYGAEKNLAVVEGFAARLDVLDYDALAAEHTGQLRAELAKAGTPIGPYDQMIAGHARSRGLTVITNNLREFQRVQGLRVEDWVSV